MNSGCCNKANLDFQQENTMEVVTAIPAVRKRQDDSHKGTYGQVLVIAGSRGMAGAAALSGLAALRSGAGLVRVATPIEVQPTVAAIDPSYITWPLPQTSRGMLDPSAWYELLSFYDGASVIAAGPGLGREEGVNAVVFELLRHTGKPLVLDADALFSVGLLKENGSILKNHRAPVIITPHPGEAARLLGKTVPEIQSNRLASAVELQTYLPAGSVVVLKGHGTVVTDSKRGYLNLTGNPDRKSVV